MEKLEERIVKATPLESIIIIQEMKIICSELKCTVCLEIMRFVSCKNSVDGYVYRCKSSTCLNYDKRISVRTGSFLEGFKISFKTFLKVIIRWCSDQGRHSILKTIDINKTTLNKILKKIFLKIKNNEDINKTKLGGIGITVNIDETMLNYKVKSHRGRSASNRTDALVIVEIREHISRVFACIIPNKKSETLIPIIKNNVTRGSIIHTDELKSYLPLCNLGFQHFCVCHKYEFINKLTGAQTQAVESFNNCIKYEIKNRKGVRTCDRELFLVEVVWKFNNKVNRFASLLSVIKI